jgi:CHASE2 domain-containing sensor protein
MKAMIAYLDRWPTKLNSWLTNWCHHFCKWKEVRVFALIIAASVGIGHFRPVLNASYLLWDAVESAASCLSKAPRTFSDKVRVVLIDDASYDSIFDATSPLPSDSLAALIATILVQGPQELIVDIDTGHNTHSGLIDAIVKKMRNAQKASNMPADETAILDSIRARVLWAKGVTRHAADAEAPRWRYSQILGGNRERWQSAAPLLQPDPDGRVRETLPCIQVETLSSGKVNKPVEAPTLITEAAIALNPTLSLECLGHSREAHPLRPRFTRYLPLVENSTLGTEAIMTGVGWFKLLGVGDLKDKVVFLGGDYAQSDRYYMADGKEHPGVILLAAGAVALAQQDHTEELGTIGDIGLEILLGLVASIILFNSPNKVKGLGGVGFAFLGVIVGSLSTSRGLGATFIPIIGLLAGVIIHALIDLARESTHLTAENQRMKKILLDSIQSTPIANAREIEQA